MNILHFINGILWGPASSFLILIISVSMCVYCRGFYILHPLKTVSKLKKSKGALTDMLTALGGSIGVGNITGVALAVKAGGAGAVFWMWICALFTMMLKFSEIVISVKTADSSGGGAMKYLKLCRFGKILSPAFCLCCIAASFGIGCTAQSNSAASAATGINIHPAIIGALLAALCALTVFGGKSNLKSVLSRLVPVMSIFYIVGALIVISANFARLPSVFREIIKGAFNIKSVSGGIAGSAFISAIRQGMSKGIFSSEAGMGSSSLIYSSDGAKDAVVQGVSGIVEVFVDTVVMCTLTALAVLSSGVELSCSASPAADAFASVFGDKSRYFLLISLFLFAYTSICCWNFYGKCCAKYLFKTKAAAYLYDAVFVIFIFIGSIVRLEAVWELSDIFNAFMLYINIFALISLFPLVKSVTDGKGDGL